MSIKKNFFYFAVLLNGVNMLIITAAGFMIPLWGDFVTHIGGDVRTAGNAICVFSIALGFLTFLAGRVEDKFHNYEWFVFTAQVVMALAYVGYFFITVPWQLYIIQLTLGVAGAFQAPAIYSLYHRVVPEAKKSSYWGAWTGLYNISIGIGSVTSAYVMHHYGYTVVFSLLVLVATLGSFASLYTALVLKNLDASLN